MFRPSDPEDFNLTYPFQVDYYRSGFSSLFRFIPIGGGKIDDNHHASNVYSGVTYLLHSPYEMFSRTSKKVQSSPDNALVIYINPQRTILDESLHEDPPEKRGCYLRGEKPLRFFKVFNKANCRSECLINATLEACGCVQFFMIRREDTRVCGVNDMKCFVGVEDEIEGNEHACGCLPDCDELTYAVDIQRMEFTK